MRTKNTKRLWPVPATLAVVAVAAFLAFGLMATNGVQPTEAQDKADCTIHLDRDGDGAVSIDISPSTDDPASDTECDAVGDTATVEFVGDARATEDSTLTVLIADKGGNITAYPAGTEWSSGQTRLEVGSEAVSAMKYRFQRITVPKAAQDAKGNVMGGKTSITVQGDLHAWVGIVTVTQDIVSIPDDNELDGAKAVNEISGNARLDVDITFLGMPVVGEDGVDFNNEIDDDIVPQCIVVDDARERIVEELAGCTNPDTSPGADTWEALDPNPDAAETRSKLLVRTGDVEEIITAGTPLIDGKMVTHTMNTDDDTVTIYAVLKDEEANDLYDTEVSFTTTTMPTGIVAARDLSDDVDAEEVVDANPDNDQIVLTGLDSATNDLVIEGIIVTGNSVATYTLDSLPDGENDSYRIEVEVTAGDLTLGTVVIAKEGQADKIVAGVFNIECFPEPMGGDADDFSDNKFKADAKGCNDSGMARRFGRGEMFVVKAHHEDVRDLVVGDGADLSAEFANEDDDLLDGDDPDEHDDPVMTGDPAQAWVYTIHEDATLGDHMITVSTDETNDDDEAIDDVTLTVTVAGPVDDYGLDGPDVIVLGGAAEYTVTAVDVNGGVPHIITEGNDANNLVNVAVQPTSTLVTGLDGSGQLELDRDTGVGKFTVYAALNAMHGDAGRIIVGPSDNLTILNISFGENRVPMAGMAIADQMVDAGSTVMVQSNFSDPDGDMLSYTAMSDMMDIATASVDDMGMVTITGVAEGMATITVTASDPGELYAMQTIMVTVEEANVAPMAGDDVADQMVYVGAMVEVQSNFSDPDEDMLSATW